MTEIATDTSNQNQTRSIHRHTEKDFAPGQLKATKGEVKPDEALMMFEYWRLCGKNVLEVSRRFERSRTAVKRVRRVYGWDKKADRLEQAEANAMAKEHAKHVISDFQIIESAIRKVADQVLAQNSKVVGRFSDLVNLVRLKLELKGDLPTQGTHTGDSTTYHVHLNKLSPEEIDEHDRNIGAIFTDNTQRSTHSRL